MEERIQKLIAASGFCSRRHAEELLRDCRVTVNGKTAILGQCADRDADTICIDGNPIHFSQSNIYIMLNKPRGFVTTAHDEKGRKNVLDLIPLSERIYPVGRLDMYSEGLLLITNDGELTNALIHPAHQIDKTYLVTVHDCTPEKIDGMRQPMLIDGYRISPAEVLFISSKEDKTVLKITIHEGRNRQIRKMAAQCGLKISRLIRVQEGGLNLGSLKTGKWRYLNDEEIAQLKNICRR